MGVGGVPEEVAQDTGQSLHLERGWARQQGRYQGSELRQAADPHGEVEGQ